MMLIERLKTDGIEPEVTRPDADMLVAGDPVHTTWNLDDDNGLYCGVWQSTPGAWRTVYEEWEYIYVHEGRAVLEADDGTVVELAAGDSLVLRPGYSGVWRVLETLRKDYVILFR
ncbi:cupin domain-containing protein [Paenirhodobacter sp.]|uniref:cupin domain-containing protein n=1 Tax=Paenirhodobacter sp. TaxID=1965326 RepID=UPI003B50E3D0